jgi:hypothetical protein
MPRLSQKEFEFGLGLRKKLQPRDSKLRECGLLRKALEFYEQGGFGLRLRGYFMGCGLSFYYYIDSSYFYFL